MRLATVVKIVVAAVAVLVVTAIAALMSLDVSRYKDELASVVEQQTGRKLSIDGEFHLSAGVRPTLSVERVRLAKVAWGSRRDMASIGRLRVELRLLPLLRGDLRIERLILDGADILLETDAAGRSNWQFAAAAPAGGSAPAGDAGQPAALPSFERIRVERARIAWRDRRSGKADEITINSLDARASSAPEGVEIALQALYGGAPLRLEGTLGPLAQLAAPASPWPFDLAAEAGGAQFEAKGILRAPLTASGLEATVTIHGNDLSTLGGLAGQALPAIGPYQLSTAIARDGALWTLRDFALAVGKSGVAGEASADLSAQPMRLRARLVSPFLDLGDFAARPTAPKAAAPGQARAPAPAPAASDGRVFPDDDFPSLPIAGLDAALDLRIARLVTDGIPLEDLSLVARVENGVLSIDPVAARLAGAPLSAMLRAERPAGSPAALSAQIDLRGLDMAALMKAAGKPPLLAGRADLLARANGQGRSLRSLMAALSGRVEITMGRGSIADETLNLLSADVLRAISPWAPRQRDLQVNCMVGRYDIRSGMLSSQATLFDSDRVMLTGEGGLNLATEQIGFTVVPHAKDVSLLQLAVPLRIGGTLAAPSVAPDAERMAKGAAEFVVTLPFAVGGKVVDTVGGLLGGSVAGGRADDNPCVIALRSAPASRRPATANSDTAKPAPTDAGSEIGRTLEGIGKGIGDGLRSLFGQ